MKHLSRDELLDAIETGLPDSRAPHLAACDRCRAEVASLRATLAKVAAVDVPEPSPLFWEHLTARVRQAVTVAGDEMALPATTVFSRARAWQWALGGAALVVCVLAFVLAPWGDTPPVTNVANNAPTPVESRAATPAANPADGDEWAFVVEVAELTGADELQTVALSISADAEDLALTELSSAERRELARLLHEALERGPHGT